MPNDGLWLAAFFLVLLLLVLNLWAAVRRGRAGKGLDALHADAERLERVLRDEVARSATATRQELSVGLGNFQRTLLTQQGDVARTQNEQIDNFRTQLAATQQHLADTLRASLQALNRQAIDAREAQDTTLGRTAEQQAVALRHFSDTLGEQLRALSQSNDQRMAEVRNTVEARLSAIQADNERKLEQMRATVEEKLQTTLQQRLGESFRQVAERLEQVHRGLGEMQGLAKDVGSLNRVLNNVKTRGIYGEVQLAGLLEQVFTVDQYATNVETIPGTGARVEFAIKLPGRRVDGAPLWLPIDAKFPRDDYERLLDAQDQANKPEAEAAGRAIENRLRTEARSIREKYIAHPHTTEFAILFLPIEGLYAEALRRPGLTESLQQLYRVTLAGPTTLLATLSSLQMGFRTLALEKRSTEVWEVLGAVKTEFAKFGDVLAKTKKKLDEASSQIDQAQTRTQVMRRKLKTVESLSESQTQALLPTALELDLASDGEEPGG